MLVVAVVIPLSISSVAYAGQAYQAARIAVSRSHALSAAVRRAGGPRGVLPCPTSAAAVNRTESTDLAWILGVPLIRVRGVTDDPGAICMPPVVEAKRTGADRVSRL